MLQHHRTTHYRPYGPLRPACALLGLPPHGWGAGAQPVPHGTGRQSSPLRPLLHRVASAAQAPAGVQGTVPLPARPERVDSGTERSPGPAQSPCPCAGVPSHRTGMLHLFGKPGFINTPRSCLHSPSPHLSRSMGSRSRKQGIAPHSPGRNPAPPDTACWGQAGTAHMPQSTGGCWEPAAHRGGCSQRAPQPRLPGSPAAAWGRGAAAGLSLW